MAHALVIEDEFLVAFSIEEALRDLGYSTVEIVSSVVEAVAAAERACPDLIVTDHEIIDGTGVDAVKAICADRSMPVVFVTGSGPQVRNRLPDALIVDKPFSFPQLKRAVASAVERPLQCAPYE